MSDRRSPGGGRYPTGSAIRGAVPERRSGAEGIPRREALWRLGGLFGGAVLAALGWGRNASADSDASDCAHLCNDAFDGGREREAWSALADMWPSRDLERIRMAIVKMRDLGIHAQVDGDERLASRRKKRACTLSDWCKRVVSCWLLVASGGAGIH